MDTVLLVTILQLYFIIRFLHMFVEGQGDIPQCRENGSKRVGQTCYHFNATPVSWYQAKSNCESKGMSLAYVESFDQAKEILTGYPIGQLVWIGASDEQMEGEFLWVASKDIATELTRFWSRGEPNNKTHPLGDEDCVGIYPTFYANDGSCNSNFSYFCMEKSCPYSLKVGQVSNERVSLSWSHYLKTETSQTFAVRFQDLVTHVLRVAGNITISRVDQNSSRSIDYRVSGLQAKTPYKMYVDAFNNNEKNVCETLTVNTKTTGPPECPVNFTIDHITHDRVSLSWTPGQTDELPQTFTIRAHNVSLFKNIPIESVHVDTVHTDTYTRVMYAVGNLSESTHYTFSVDVENNNGIRKCKDNVVQVTTTSGLRARSLPSWLLFLLIFIPLVLAAGIAGFFIYKRKAHMTSSMEVPNTYDSLTKELSAFDSGNGTDLVYSAPIGLSALHAAPSVEQDTTEHDYEPMNSDPVYANSSDMTRVVPIKFSETEKDSIYKNL